MTHRIGPGYQSARIDQGACLNCGKPLTGAGSLYADRVPEPGDVLVCAYCSHVMEWTGERLAEPSDETLKVIAGDKRMLDAVAFSTAFQRFGKGKAK
jgi:hypothetical protein